MNDVQILIVVPYAQERIGILLWPMSINVSPWALCIPVPYVSKIQGQTVSPEQPGLDIDRGHVKYTDRPLPLPWGYNLQHCHCIPISSIKSSVTGRRWWPRYMTSLSLECIGCHNSQKSSSTMRQLVLSHRHCALHIDQICYMAQPGLFVFSFLRLTLYDTIYSLTMIAAPWVVPLLGFPHMAHFDYV